MQQAGSEEQESWRSVVANYKVHFIICIHPQFLRYHRFPNVPTHLEGTLEVATGTLAAKEWTPEVLCAARPP